MNYSRLCCFTVFSVTLFGNAQAKILTPNVIIIMTDDQGYQDLGCYGSPLIKTPCIDKMAKEGLVLTDYYVSSSVSSASRAGLMTGKLNTKNGIPGVLWPGEDGLADSEITIAEALKTKGYVTACFGKWHLGDTEGHLPTGHGFDEYLGIPYSNDMYIGPTQKLSDKIVFREGFDRAKTLKAQEIVRNNKKLIRKNKLNNLVPLLKQNEIIEYPCDQSTLTRRYFDNAIDFVERYLNSPFFLYITPNMPHTPLDASKQFMGKSERGLYGDAIEEIDWNVGRLLDYLDEKGLSENTLVVFTSDNGPWLGRGEHGGSAFPLRDGKFSQYEGGVRTPCIIRWKNQVKPGQKSSNMFASIDWFPTIISLAGADEIKHEIDGINQKDFLKDTSLKLNM